MAQDEEMKRTLTLTWSGKIGSVCKTTCGKVKDSHKNEEKLGRQYEKSKFVPSYLFLESHYSLILSVAGPWLGHPHHFAAT